MAGRIDAAPVVEIIDDGPEPEAAESVEPTPRRVPTALLVAAIGLFAVLGIVTAPLVPSPPLEDADSPAAFPVEPGQTLSIGSAPGATSDVFVLPAFGGYVVLDLDEGVVTYEELPVSSQGSVVAPGGPGRFFVWFENGNVAGVDLARGDESFLAANATEFIPGADRSLAWIALGQSPTAYLEIDTYGIPSSQVTRTESVRFDPEFVADHPEAELAGADGRTLLGLAGDRAVARYCDDASSCSLEWWTSDTGWTALPRVKAQLGPQLLFVSDIQLATGGDWAVLTLDDPLRMQIIHLPTGQASIRHAPLGAEAMHAVLDSSGERIVTLTDDRVTIIDLTTSVAQQVPLPPGLTLPGQRWTAVVPDRP